MRLFGLSLFLFLLCGVCACEKKASIPKINVAVAANFAEPLRALKATFEKENACRVELIIGSSGTLTNQIRQGAPYDLFFSADRTYPEILFSEGFSQAPPEVYALGILVLSASSPMDLDKPFCELIDENALRVGLPNPALAPYGRSAIEFLRQQDCWTALESDLVYAQNVNQLNQYLLSGMIDLGFTSYSSTFLKGFGQVFTPIKTESIQLEQACILLDGKNEQREWAEAFYNYMLSKPVQDELSQMGYGQSLQ